MYRVYLNGELAREEHIPAKDVKRIRVDTGRVVLGVPIPEGKDVLYHEIHRGKRIVSVYLWTDHWQE